MVRKDGTVFDLPALLRERTGGDVRYEPAFWTTGIVSNWQKPHKAFLDAAVCDTSVVCVGTGADIEFEGGDRASMRLPAVQENMILEIARRSKRTVVVLFAGSAIDMSAWQDAVSAIVWAGFCGEAGGEALADILAGIVCPSGKLSETIPLCYEDTPAYDSYRDACVERYQEGLDVGYRYYDTYSVPVAFPFGYGLSYARFAYSGLQVKCEKNTLRLRFSVENTSETDGKEVVQAYLHPVQTFVYRPEKELKEYRKVFVGAGEKKEIELELTDGAFAYWSTALDGWQTDNGLYEVLIGASSREIYLRALVAYENGTFSLVSAEE